MNRQIVMSLAELKRELKAPGARAYASTNGLIFVELPSERARELSNDGETALVRDVGARIFTCWRPRSATHDNETPLQFPQVGEHVELYRYYEGNFVTTNGAPWRFLVAETISRAVGAGRSRNSTLGVSLVGAVDL